MRHNIDEKSVISLYESGKSIYQIAQELKIGKSTAHRIIKANNARRPKTKQENNLDNEICNYYLQGNSALGTASKFGTSPTQVYRILERNNISRRSLTEAGTIACSSTYKPEPKSRSITPELLRHLYIDKEMTCQDIADKYGYNVNTLNYYRSKYGIKRDADKAKMIKSKISKQLWADSKFKENMSLAVANTAKVSSIQTILYSILDDLNIYYYRERDDGDDDPQCHIGPYSFDCVIPREGMATLLIECQGEYWHSLPGVISKDANKAAYIANNFSDQYELKYLHEHEFSNYHYIVNILKSWLKIDTINQIEFEFRHVTIATPPKNDYKLLLGKYHYLPNAGRGGIVFGAYLNNTLIAVCIFSPPIRHNTDDPKTTRELSRLCIHPSYQKKNFASWFISKCIKSLPKQYKRIVSYADTTFGHDGTIYKAANFKHISTIKPDYWYRSPSGWIMHKRTLYGKAKSMSTTESDYAAKHGYKKVYGKEKYKFLFIK